MSIVAFNAVFTEFISSNFMVFSSNIINFSAWLKSGFLTAFSFLFDVGHFIFKSFLKVSVVSNLLKIYRGPCWGPYTGDHFYQAYWPEIPPSTHNFLTIFFKRPEQRFITFSWGFINRAENCRNNLFFKAVFTFANHHFSLK